jgi:hypothetical protein
MPLASDFGTGQVFLSMLWFFLFFIWIWLLIVVFSDLFRSHDIGGWAKAFWVIGIIILPYLGVLLYLIVRGHKMAEHAQEAAAAQDAAAKAYIQQAAGTSGSAADEIQRLADLKAQGVISDAEFEAGKAKALGGLTAVLHRTTRGPGSARGLVASGGGGPREKSLGRPGPGAQGGVRDPVDSRAHRKRCGGASAQPGFRGQGS